MDYTKAPISDEQEATPSDAPTIRRDAKGRVLRGSSLNPSGRPKLGTSLAERCRAATNNGDDLVAFFRDTMDDPKVHRRERLEAARWLADRGHGRAPETVLQGQLGSEQLAAVAELSKDELLALVDATPPPEATQAAQEVESQWLSS